MKGIVDPWRLVTPLKPKQEIPQEAKKRIDPAEIDFDADLRLQARYIFASPHGSIMVTGCNIPSEDAALRALTRCIQTISLTKQGRDLLLQAGIGHTFGDPPPYTRLETKSEPYASIYFINQSYTEGMLQLIKVLNTVRRHLNINLNHWGVSTTLR